MEESQAPTVLGDDIYDDPSQLSQALWQRVGSEKSFHFTTSTESPNSGDNTVSTFTGPLEASHAFLRASVGLAQFDRALSPRRATTAKHVKPALPKHHSTPTSTRNVQLDRADKMYHSFNIPDAPGDTQPDSQMMKTWTSGIFPTIDGREIRVPQPKSLFVEHSEEENNDDSPTDEMEVVASSQQIHVPTPMSHTMIDVDEQGDTAQNSLAPTSPLKFQTPALGDRKRVSSGQMLSSAMRTSTTPGSVPSAPFFFGNEAGGGEVQHISLTQAFNNTQAPTSPMVDCPGEDVVFTRPSPNFTHARHSSPMPAYSSPIKATRRDTPKSEPIMRSSSVPRTDYVTTKESQERRNRSVGNEHNVIVEQDSWEELSRKVKARKSREYARRQVAESLSHVSAPMHSLSPSEIKRTMSAGYPSPGKSCTSRSVVRATSHDDDVFMNEQSQTIMVNEANKHNSDHSADETSQTTRDAARTVAEYNNIQVPKTSSHPHRTPSVQPSGNSTQQPRPSSQRKTRQRESGSQYLRAAIQPSSSKESIAVMDSQPDATADFESVPRPKSLRFPSSPMMSQYSINQTTMATKTGYTSQVISSSIPPLPPKSSPEIVTPEEDRVPSSPPLMVPGDGEEEGDLEYDEHAYDEHAEGVAEDDTMPSPDNDADVAMDEDEDEEDLPLPKEESEDEDADNESSQEGYVDMAHPCKVEVPDDEASGTLDQEQPEGHVHYNQESRRNNGDNPSNAPRMQRQNTIPDTDALDDTQPSCFPDSHSGEVIGDDAAVHNNTNNTEQFQTAQEEPSGSQSNMPAPRSSRDQGSDTMTGGSRIRSIDDIYNLPETQQSPVEEDVEMPRLSGVEEDDEDVSMSRSSPALPPAKRRKITYTGKRPVFRDSTTATADATLSGPPSSPHVELAQDVLEATPPIATTQEQEDQGARTAARLREEAQVPYKPTTSLKSKVLPKPKKPQNQRHGALKPVSRELLQSVSSPANSPSRPKVSVRNRATTPVTPSKPKEVASKAPTKTPADVNMTDADNDTVGPTSSAPPPSNVEKTPSQHSETPPDDIVVPNRVFACWPGSHYYPATCLGRATSRLLQIRYDDGNITSVDAMLVRALDLRKGDHVKVDKPGMKKNTYVVVGFKHKMHDVGCEEFPTTDQRGHASVILEEKSRGSLPAAKALQTTGQISVPVSDVYLTAGLWKRLRDRSYNFGSLISPAKTASHIGTPVPDHFATPSFTRRGTAAPSLLKDLTTRAGSVASTTRSGTGVFVNMAFVLTSTAADVDKEAITKTIRRNGGQVLEHGFHELFDYESSDAPSSPQKRRRSTSSVEGPGLSLKQAYRDLGFVALLSDSHSRSTKYIQALALNVPCLHLRWIQDSVNASRAAPFSRYLLPAGVSKFLDPNGVIRSRTMAPYDPAGEDTSFAQTIQTRDLLFNNQNVLLVTGKSKKEMDKRQPFVFLSHALGSASVGLCADLDTAADMLGDNKWDWVYVDNGERGVAVAAAMLFGTEKPAPLGKTKKGGKKRRRSETEPEPQDPLFVKSRVGMRDVRITCAEFVIQSLILGVLVEE
ncbi:Rad9 Rad53 bind domain containing protein [Pyrenophora tritici-repentis]|nr:Rad9 Rad53 bind domain containing protein [Pyrenophora tritici-repentis]